MPHRTAVALRLVCLVAVVGVGGCLTLGGSGSGDPEVRDLQQMQGEWRLAETTGFGQTPPSGEGADLLLTIKGRDLALLAPGREGKGDQVLYRGAVRLHPACSPKAIDLVFAENGKVKTRPGIYALEGGRLRLCLAVPVQGLEERPQRPTDFSCPPGQPYLVQTFVRGKGR
ncbi:MAG: TIGR03067 domain-containing protein [Gemmataceae bacterium]|nr:TIGR03067 domain-containing protein [Gemmataceae bacterium]